MKRVTRVSEPPPRPDERQLRALAERHGQGHIFRFFDKISPFEQEKLLDQVAAIDFELVDRLVDHHVRGVATVIMPDLSPADIIRLPHTDEERARAAEARAAGEEALRAGRVAVFQVAGGQGTRLGMDKPKGVFPIGPVSKRSLFQLHAEKIYALRRRYNASLPWIVMTSDANDTETQDYFRKVSWFGLPSPSVRFIRQDSVPAVSREGKIVLDTPSHIQLSPNGHGGSLKALHSSGVLDELSKAGIDTIFYFQVDNVLLRLADPTFLGYHLKAGAEMSLKVLRKSCPEEKVGVYALDHGAPTVVEYSDLPAKAAEARRSDGSLMYWAGSIAIHVLDVGFVRRLNEGTFRLPWHKAEKAVPYVDDAGQTVRPTEKNAVKFETFVFDALPRASVVAAMEVAREEEFSPVKNATGVDSAESAKRDLVELYSRWLEAAGAKVKRDEQGRAANPVEISPLTSLEGENLDRWRGVEVRPGATI